MLPAGSQSKDARPWFPAGSPDLRSPAHVRPQGLGDGDRAVGVLVVLEERDEEAGAGEDGVVEGVAEDGVALAAGAAGAVAHVEAAALEVVQPACGVGLAVGPR